MEEIKTTFVVAKPTSKVNDQFERKERERGGGGQREIEDGKISFLFRWKS